MEFLRRMILTTLLAMSYVAAAVPARAGAAPAPALARYDTSYYVIYSDLDPPVAAEAVVRMKVLADLYRARTRELGFSGRIRARLPVYLFKDRADYLATGAPPESAGAFLGDRLVAAASDRAGRPAWNVIQHEAFHQFAAAVNGPELPGWVTEGLADYFGEALFTGDGYVAGVVPGWRAARVKKSIRDGTFVPLQRLLQMSQAQWNEKVVLAHYDQAWSLVQFILASDDGRKRCGEFVQFLSRGQAGDEAWPTAFGQVADFERRWRDHWLDLPDGGATEAYAEAAAATVTSFLARSAAAGQRVKTFEEFIDAARGGTLETRADDWLPAGLLHDALRRLPDGVKWSIARQDDAPRAVLALADRTTFVGSFRLQDGRVTEVLVRRHVPHKE